MHADLAEFMQFTSAYVCCERLWGVSGQALGIFVFEERNQKYACKICVDADDFVSRMCAILLANYRVCRSNSVGICFVRHPLQYDIYL